MKSFLEWVRVLESEEHQDEIKSIEDQIEKIRPLVAANPVLRPAIEQLEERLEKLRGAQKDTQPFIDLDAMKSDFLKNKANQKVHPSMLEMSGEGHVVQIAIPGRGETVVMDGQEMKMSSQSGGGFTKRGAEFNDSMVFIGGSGRLEMPVSEWMKLARSGKIIKRADGKFEIMD